MEQRVSVLKMVYDDANGRAGGDQRWNIRKNITRNFENSSILIIILKMTFFFANANLGGIFSTWAGGNPCPADCDSQRSVKNK